MQTQNLDYRGYSFPPESISYAVWLSHRFSLSFRDVEEVWAERGVTVSYEAMSLWWPRCGQEFAQRRRDRQGRRGDPWHLDDMCVTLHGARHSWWRAVEQDGAVLESLVQKRRHTHAAQRFFRKLLKGLPYLPHKLGTDKLASYGAARRAILSSVPQCQGGRQNTRAEGSQQPMRPRARQRRRFPSSRQAQRFLSVHGPIYNLFR